MRFLPGGVSSENRGPKRGIIPGKYPMYFRQALGSRITDVDGNEFIDFLMGFGALLLGHANPAVNEAVHEQIEKGSMYGLNSELEFKVAEKVVDASPCGEQAIFLVTGSEANSAAVRLARAYTGKDTIGRFDVGYNGWHDAFLVTPNRPGFLGIPRTLLKTTVMLPWNDVDGTTRLIRSSRQKLAAVICESYPYVSPDKEFLPTLREITERLGILLIFDEVKTGFRLAFGGTQEFLGITADIATYSKAFANGFPISAVAASAEIMRPVAEFEVPYWGTFNAYPVSLAAALATLRELDRNKDTVYPNLHRLGRALKKSFLEALSENGYKCLALGADPMPWVVFSHLKQISTSKQERTLYRGKDAELRWRLSMDLVKRGILSVPDHPWFVSSSHSEKDIHTAVNMLRDSIRT